MLNWIQSLVLVNVYKSFNLNLDIVYRHYYVHAHFTTSWYTSVDNMQAQLAICWTNCEEV